MDSKILVFPGETTPRAAYCGKCLVIFRTGEEAERCCTPPTCRECGGLVDESYWLACYACRVKKEAEKEQAIFAAATQIDWTPDTPVLYDEEHDRWLNDEDDAEYAETRFAYATTPFELKLPEAYDLVSDALAEHHEDALDRIPIEMLKEMDDFLTDWAQRSGVVSYAPDYSRIVIFDPALTTHD